MLQQGHPEWHDIKQTSYSGLGTNDMQQDNVLGTSYSRNTRTAYNRKWTNESIVIDNGMECDKESNFTNNLSNSDGN